MVAQNDSITIDQEELINNFQNYLSTLCIIVD